MDKISSLGLALGFILAVGCSTPFDNSRTQPMTWSPEKDSSRIVDPHDMRQGPDNLYYLDSETRQRRNPPAPSQPMIWSPEKDATRIVDPRDMRQGADNLFYHSLETRPFSGWVFAYYENKARLFASQIYLEHGKILTANSYPPDEGIPTATVEDGDGELCTYFLNGAVKTRTKLKDSVFLSTRFFDQQGTFLREKKFSKETEKEPLPEDDPEHTWKRQGAPWMRAHRPEMFWFEGHPLP